MSGAAILYLVAMSVLFVGQRLLDGNDGPQSAVTILGLVLLIVAAGLRVAGLRAANDAGLRLGHRVALIGVMVGGVSLLLYAATTDIALASMALGDEAEARWLGVWRSLWPLVWMLGTVPMLAVDYACQSAPIMMPTQRVRELALHGLVAAIGLGIVFPVNYIASQTKERWDLAYFKTPVPGTATQALVEALEVPVDVRIFMPPSSEVAQELEVYFASLEGPLLRVEVIDQAAEPRLAQALSVRDNGTIAFTQGEVKVAGAEDEAGESPKPITRTIQVGADFERAKRTLKGIDADVQKVLIELGQGERVAYFTTGHGELSWTRSAEPALDRKVQGLRDELRALGFTVKELGLRQKLAEGVPEDASVVFVLAPMHPLLRVEVDALRAYVESGGSLMVGLEPKPLRPDLPPPPAGPLEDMLEEVMGVRMVDGVVADEVNHVPMYRNVRDNFFVATDAYSSHGASLTLAAERAPMSLPAPGHLELVQGHEAGSTVLVRTMATAFADLDGNGKFDAESGEVKGAKPVVAAISGSTNGVGWRAVVSADASLMSDAGLGNDDVPAGSIPGIGLRGNFLFVRDATNWLIGAEALSGTTQSEEDVKIEHTKDGQTWWFYSTVLGVPLLVFSLGAVRVWLRQRGTLVAGGGR